MYRVTAIIINGEVVINSTEYAYAENKLTYTIMGSDGDIFTRVKKKDVDVIYTKHHEDKISVAPYRIWTFNPAEAKELLLIRVAGEIQKRINYVNSIKHLV